MVLAFHKRLGNAKIKRGRGAVKRWLWLTVAFLIMLMLMGCRQKSTDAADAKVAGQEDEPVEILLCRWNNMDQNNEIMTQLIKEFQEQYKGRIALRVEVVPGLENLISHVRIKISSGEMPDLIDTSGYELSSLVKDADKVADLMPYVEADPEFKRWIGEENLRDNVVDGKLSSITAQKNVIGYWYNKELFKQAGIQPAATWPQFWDNCEKLIACGIHPMALDTRQSAWPTNILLGAIVGSDGADGTKFMQTYHPTDYTSTGMVEALGQIQTCFRRYVPGSAVTANYGIAEGEFFSGSAAMLFNGAWLALDLSDPEKAPPGLTDQVGAAIYPNATVYSLASPGYVVGNNSPKRIAAAAEFIKFMCSPKVQERIAVEIKAVPVNPEVDLQGQLKQENPLMYDMLEAAKEAKIKIKDYQAMWYPVVYNEGSKLYPQLMYGKITPAEMAQQMTELAQKAQQDMEEPGQ